MKIRRGPRSNDTLTTTDRKNIARWARRWTPGAVLQFDGTIDKKGQRHTAIGVELEETDIIALSAGLLNHYKNRSRDLEKKNADLVATVNKLENVLARISSLVSNRKARAANLDELLLAVEEVADHFRWNFYRAKPR